MSFKKINLNHAYYFLDDIKNINPKFAKHKQKVYEKH